MRRRPLTVFAAATSSRPCPSTNGLPTGPGDAEPSRAALTVLGWAWLWVARSSAAAPLVMAALNDVPEPTQLPVPMRAEGLLVSMVEPGASRLTTDRPEVTRSGLNQPSGLVGPALENVAMVSPEGDTAPWSSTAPTVMTDGSSPGDRTVPLNGPELPADTTTTMPA